MSETVASKIERYVHAGGGFFAWHSGLASYPASGTYYQVLGGRFISHPSSHQRVEYEVWDQHPLAKTLSSFTIIDEHYFVEIVPGVDVLLTSQSVDGASIAGWTRSHGWGRAVCLTPAHRSEAFANPEMRAVVQASLRWILDAQDPG